MLAFVTAQDVIEIQRWIICGIAEGFAERCKPQYMGRRLDS